MKAVIRLLLLASAWLVIVPTSALSQICPAAQFGSTDARSEAIQNTVKLLASITSRIEAVPPAEAEYIDREERAALGAENRARFNIVSGNRFYRAHQVAKVDREMKANLTAATKEHRLKERALLLSAILSKQVDLVEAIGEYVKRDRSLPQPVQTDAALREISYDLVILQSNILRNLQCSVQLMREPT